MGLQGTPWPWMPSAPFKPPRMSNPRDAIARIQFWMANCRDRHDCSLLESRRLPPKRMIHVGAVGKHPRLCRTKGKVGHYVALSHCWGPKGQRHLITTPGNLRSHLRGIPLQDFPATFRDAITVTRALGFKYLWIDSLCIVQDSMEDWISESTKMADIYRSASLTLAADFGASPAAGLFPKNASALLKVRTFMHVDAQGTQHQTFVRIAAWPRPKGHPEARTCYGSEAVSRLDTRAWVLQERVLSHRTVVFSSSELFWQCCKIHECSCGNRLKHYTIKDTFEMFLKAPETGVVDGQQCWQHLIEDYTSRQLTFATDRLPALAGVASMAPFPVKDYLAGLWRTTLRRDLVWLNPVGRNSKRLTHPPDSFPTLAGDGVNWRIPDKYAPSWSWASITGPVVFGFLLSADDISQEWHVFAAQCTPRTANPYGPVSEGFVDIVGDIFPIAIREMLKNVEQASDGKVTALRELCVIVKGREDVLGLNKSWMDAGLGAREWLDEESDYFSFILGMSTEYGAPVGMVLRRARKAKKVVPYSRIGMALFANWSGQDTPPAGERLQFRIV